MTSCRCSSRPSSGPANGAASNRSFTSSSRRWVTCRRPGSPAAWRSPEPTENTRNARPNRLQRASLGPSGNGRRAPRSRWPSSHRLTQPSTAFNRYSPRFIASLISENRIEQDRFFDLVDAPFVGKRFNVLGRRAVRPRQARARSVELGARSTVRPWRDPLGGFGLHRPVASHTRRSRHRPLTVPHTLGTRFYVTTMLTRFGGLAMTLRTSPLASHS